LQAAQRVDPVHAGHHHVEQDDVGRVALLHGRNHLVPTGIRPRVVSTQRQKGAQVIGERGIVVDDRDVRFSQRFDSVIGNDMITDPRAKASSPPSCLRGDQIRPPTPSTTRRASGSARPRPPRFSSNAPGALSYAVCTLPSSATTITAEVWPSREAYRRSAATTHGPAFSRRTARKTASRVLR